MKWRSYTALVALALSAVGCSILRPTDAPLERWEYFGRGRPGQTLIVFLPGIFDSTKDFDTYGFVQAARDAGIDADMVAVQAHVRHYAEGVLIERLHRDIIEPARLRGYPLDTDRGHIARWLRRPVIQPRLSGVYRRDGAAGAVLG